eukprot:TRINITY_DN11600_c0_g1_i14.p1 TRINITY_DN11600_c0_g1~~TRINITY_DN11600_c0_g1_i14.p1  ORF type:complete len:149 (+),score=41.19 TRINITY_DN11600_c0_g1_i14:188-634(+)
MLFVVGNMNTVVAGLVTFCWLAADVDIYSPTGPTIMVLCFAKAITSFFTILYQYTIETIMECFCEDQERNDGSFMRKYYMTPGLKQLLLNDLKQSSDNWQPDEQTSPTQDDVVDEEDVEIDRSSIKLQGMDPTQIQEMEELSLYYIPA